MAKNTKKNAMRINSKRRIKQTVKGKSYLPIRRNLSDISERTMEGSGCESEEEEIICESILTEGSPSISSSEEESECEVINDTYCSPSSTPPPPPKEASTPNQDATPITVNAETPADGEEQFPLLPDEAWWTSPSAQNAEYPSTSSMGESSTPSITTDDEEYEDATCEISDGEMSEITKMKDELQLKTVSLSEQYDKVVYLKNTITQLNTVIRIKDDELSGKQQVLEEKKIGEGIETTTKEIRKSCC